jgi:hypothetical protein
MEMCEINSYQFISDFHRYYQQKQKYIPFLLMQNPYIEEEQTTQWSKEKVEKDKE